MDHGLLVAYSILAEQFSSWLPECCHRWSCNFRVNKLPKEGGALLSRARFSCLRDSEWSRVRTTVKNLEGCKSRRKFWSGKNGLGFRVLEEFAMAVLGYEVTSWTEGLLIGQLVAFLASAYIYWFIRRLPQGFPRVIASLPVFTAYAYVPLIFNRETHIIGLSVYFCVLTWLASFKLLLLCWSAGPGYDPWVATSFPRFAVAMTYPVHMKRAGKVVKRVAVKYPSWIDAITKSEVWYMLLLRSALKTIAMGILLQILRQRDSFPLIVIHFLFCVQLYLFVTIVLEIIAAFANTVFGIIIEPHFDNPFAAVSLEEFWARRWNLLVSNCLRETVLNPVYYLLRRAKSEEDDIRVGISVEGESTKGFDVPKLLAMLAAFLVSGLAHELCVYYMTLQSTGRMNSFFVVQGLAVALEAAWKVYFSDMRPSPWVGRSYTLGFAFMTSHWLFWPPIDSASDQVLIEVTRMLPF